MPFVVITRNDFAPKFFATKEERDAFLADDEDDDCFYPENEYFQVASENIPIMVCQTRGDTVCDLRAGTFDQMRAECEQYYTQCQADLGEGYDKIVVTTTVVVSGEFRRTTISDGELARFEIFERI